MKTLLMLVSLLALGTWSTPSSTAQHPDPRAAIFVTRGCNACHAVSGLGLKASNATGPDLTFAYGDVVSRYGVNLQAFLSDPGGVMKLVLAAQHRVSIVDRDSIVQILRRLYEERKASLAPGALTSSAFPDSLGRSVPSCRRLAWLSLPSSE
jgi:hypothetical protein